MRFNFDKPSKNEEVDVLNSIVQSRQAAYQEHLSQMKHVSGSDEGNAVKNIVNRNIRILSLGRKLQDQKEQMA